MPDAFEVPVPGLSPVEIINLGPIIDPPFVDARDWSEYLTPVETYPVEFEIHESRFDQEARGRAVETVLSSERMATGLDGKRAEVISVGMRSLDRDTEHPVVVIYDYDDDVVLEAFLDPDGDRVVDVVVKRYQPPLTDSELSQALDLVKQENWLLQAGIDVDAGGGLVVDEVNIHSPRHGHRLVDLRFGRPNSRVPSAYAIVDLSAQEVIRRGILEQEAAP
jgi:hypothetical protein